MGKKKRLEKLLQQTNTGQIPKGIVVSQSQHFSGPLPPPNILERYDQIVPGGAERIFKKFEDQTEHRIAIEKSVIRTSNIKEIGGLIAGFIIAMTTIVGGIYTAILGHNSWLGGSLSFTGLALLAGAFLRRR